MGLVRADSAWARERGVPASSGFVSERLTCGRCGELLPVQPHQGRPRKWCSETCRVADYRARRAAGGQE